jgi:hypothetical protein
MYHFFQKSVIFVEKITAMTITIPNSLETEKLEKLLKFLGRERIAFSFDPVALLDEQVEIQHRLHKKYVVSGEWDSMSFDEKEDAAALEKMLMLEGTGDAKPLDSEQNSAFLNELKTWLV